MNLINVEEIMSKKQRNENIERVEVLKQVGNILSLPGTELSTIKQVAEYYNVNSKTIQSVVNRHRNELKSDGMKTYSIDELKNNFGGFMMNQLNNNKNTLFTQRSILRIGMLLTGSNVAKEIRTRLLDVKEAADNTTQNNGKTITENTIIQIKSEEEINKEIYEAMMSGNTQKLSFLQMQLISITKNKLNIANNTINAQQVQINMLSAITNSINSTTSLTKLLSNFKDEDEKSIPAKNVNKYLVDLGYAYKETAVIGTNNGTYATDKMPQNSCKKKTVKYGKKKINGVFQKHTEEEPRWTSTGLKFIIELLVNNNIIGFDQNGKGIVIDKLEKYK